MRRRSESMWLSWLATLIGGCHLIAGSGDFTDRPGSGGTGGAASASSSAANGGGGAGTSSSSGMGAGQVGGATGSGGSPDCVTCSAFVDSCLQDASMSCATAGVMLCNGHEERIDTLLACLCMQCSEQCTGACNIDDNAECKDCAFGLKMMGNACATELRACTAQ